MNHLDDKVKKRFGDNFFLVESNNLINNKIIVSDGTYNYEVSDNNYINKFGYSSMTHESRLKFLSEKCCEGIKVTNIKNTNSLVIAEFTHIETGIIKTRSVRTNRINKSSIGVLTQIDRTNYFRAIIKEKTGDKFDCSKMEYVSTYDKMTLICPDHGEFYISANSIPRSIHICSQCGREARYGFSKSAFINACGNRDGNIYIVRCFNEDEEFIKIGVTAHANLKRRFTGKDLMPYEYEEILVANKNPEFIFNLEHEVHRAFKQNKYVPILSFHGYKECFNISIKQKAISLIEELLVSL